MSDRFQPTFDDSRRDEETDPFYQAVKTAIENVEAPAPQKGSRTGKAHEQEIQQGLEEAFGINSEAAMAPAPRRRRR